MRNKGLSYVFLEAAIKKFLKFKKMQLVAEIKKNNSASINCFLKNKFYFLKKKIIIIFTKDL
jgi:L-amino acid N-acyltransferase YncA